MLALKRRTWWIGGVAVVLGVLLCSLVIVQSGASTNAQPKPKPTRASVPAFDIATPASDAFDWWNAELTSEQVQFLGSDDLDDGISALAITSNLVGGSGEVFRLQEGIGATVGTTYTLGLWAKSTDAGEGAIKTSAKQIDGQTFSIIDTASEGVQSSVYTGGQADTRVMWSVGAPQSVEISTKVSVTVTNQLGVATVLKPKAGVVTVELSESPVYVKGAVSAVAAS